MNIAMANFHTTVRQNDGNVSAKLT